MHVARTGCELGAEWNKLAANCNSYNEAICVDLTGPAMSAPWKEASPRHHMNAMSCSSLGARALLR